MKRLLSILIAIALMLSLSVTAFAAEEPTLYVAGVAVTSDNLEINSADNGAITGSAKYDPVTNTLTLDNFSYTGEGYAIPDTESDAVIYSYGNLKLKLVGVNSITFDNSANLVVASEGLYVKGDLTVTDDSNGSLTATAGYLGIYSAGNLTIPGGNTSVKAIGTDGDSIGIHSDGNLTINGGKVEAIGSSCGIAVQDGLTFNGGMATVKGSEYGIMSQYDIIINSGTLEATASGDYGIGIVGGAVTVNGGTVEVISTGEYGYGITTYDGVSCNGDFAVYAGEAAPGELVTSPTTSTYNSKYVKIAPAELEPETQTTTITYQVDPTFTVTIPATVALGETATIKAENVVVAKGKQVEVTLTNANGFKVTTQQGAELSYTVTKDETAVNVGDTVLTVNPDNGKTGETTLTFSNPTETAKFAGDYTGTITFTVAVKDAPVTIINFTMDSSDFEEWIPGLTTNLQAEEGMTWAEWIESDYNVDGYVMSEYYDGIDYVYPAGEDWVAVRNTQIDGFGGIVLPTDEIIADNTYTLIQILG